MPIDRDRLIEPEQLRSLQASDQDVLVVDIGAAERHAGAHIPGAVHVAPAELVSGIPPAAGQLPDADRLAALCSRLGLTPATLVIASDDEGGGWAGRFIWTLEVIGHRNWKVLDGGIHAWHQAGLPLVATPTARTAVPAEVVINRAPIADAADVLTAIEHDSAQIWDARSPEEYRGERVSAARGGHMPGALNLDWLELIDQSRALRLRADAEALIAARGIDLSRPLITHCQSHHRSGLTWLVATLLGATDVRGYHGSWAEWGNLEDVPVRQGAEP